ncbi:MAG TPA: hypothetical protein VGU26_00560 [Gaiellaceae bacterium]|jgi:hypothetical protein|nr:hypothetical protein [Gaiellaceae bacterium]
MTDITTVWGKTTLVDEVKIRQRAGEKRFACLVQLLQDEKGDPLVRFAYSTDGVVRRGPVTLRRADLERLRSALGDHEALAAALGFLRD